MKLFEAWAVVVVSVGIYVFSAWLLSDFCLFWSWVPIVAFSVYPYLKRFTTFAHLGLGLVWSLVPLAGFLAVTASFEGIEPVVVLSVFCIFWLAGFDIIYATLDEDFDREEKLFSFPAAFGANKALKFAAGLHVGAFLTLVFLYGFWLSGPITVMLLAILGLFFYLEQKYSAYVDFAFFQVNVLIGFVVFFFILSGLKGF